MQLALLSKEVKDNLDSDKEEEWLKPKTRANYDIQIKNIKPKEALHMIQPN